MEDSAPSATVAADARIENTMAGDNDHTPDDSISTGTSMAESVIKEGERAIIESGASHNGDMTINGTEHPETTTSANLSSLGLEKPVENISITGGEPVHSSSSSSPSITPPVTISSRGSGSGAATGTLSSMVFVHKALETVSATKDGRRGPLQASLKKALDGIKDSSVQPATIFEALRLATLTNNSDIKVVALDCIGKLFSFSYFVGTISDGGEDRRPAKLVDFAVETVCDCFKADYTEERVELQIIKALLAAILNEKLVVHGAALLKAIRQTYNIFILSRFNSNQAIAQATLTQAVNVIFERVKSRMRKRSDLKVAPNVEIRGSATSLSENTSNLEMDMTPKESAGELSISQNGSVAINKEPTRLGEDEQVAGHPNGILPSPAGEKITLESFENRKSFDEERTAETVTDDLKNENELFVRDAFLVFRAMCKLSIKSIDASGNVDLKSHAMRSKLLSLHLIYAILSSHMVIFSSPDVIIRSNSSSEETLFVHAIRQYLCLCLSRNATSPVPAVFEICCDLFWLILLNLRSQMKKEIEVFISEIYLSILEMKNSSPHQKQYLLGNLEKLCSDPRALVEIYLNYDCDNKVLVNIYERLLDYLSKISATPVHLTPFQLQQYQEQHKNVTPAHSGVAIPPSFSIAASSIQAHSIDASIVPIEYILKRQALECLVAVLRSLVTWSQNGIADATARFTESTHETEHSTEECSRSGTPGTPSASTVNLGLEAPTRTNGRTTPIDDPTQFESLKHRKTALLDGIRMFNFKPKRGIDSLVENGFLSSRDPQEIASFLLNTEGLSKTMIGEYLGEGDAENVSIMHAFIDFMDFTSMKFVDALRRFLQAFRLPGEAQKIDRFMLKFAERYISGNPDIFANADTAYVLAYSVIMLNTDLHSPQVKNRMTKDDFFKNNKGINDNADLPSELLNEIYDEILTNEIILKSEHEAALLSGVPQTVAAPTSLAANIGQVIATVGRDLQRESYIQASREMANKTETLFKNLVRAQRNNDDEKSSIFYSASHIGHVGPMFEVVWMSFLAGLSGPMQDTDDPDIIRSCLEGMKLAIRIACLFDVQLARISFVSSLSKYTNLQNLSEMKTKHVEAVKSLLDVALLEGNLLKDSWKDVLLCISQLERFQLISSGISEGVIPDISLARLASRDSSESQRSKSSVSLSRQTRARSGSIVTPFSVIVAEESRGREIVIAMDKIFTQSAVLSGDAIVHFVRALTEVSREEIQSSGQSANPRTFSLQKMVDVSYYNMDRIRVEWSNLWAIMGEQFNQVGCHSNTTVVFFALDSLRQLSMRFFEMEELPHFKFQKDFLRSFEHIFVNNSNLMVKDMVLRCLHQMILARAGNVRSGWATMFGVFTFAAAEQSESLVSFSLENVKLIYCDHFELVMAQGSFAGMAVCLTELAKNHRFQKISLHSIEMLRGMIGKMMEYQDAVLDGEKLGNSSMIKASIEDPSVKFWFPILFAFHDIIMTGEDLEVRSRALNYLFDTLVQYGGDYQPDFWDLVCRQLLFPIFIVLKSRSEMSRFNNHEDMSVWLSTTMIQALRNLIALFTHYFDALERMLDGFLDLLISCICQENDTLARIGSSCLQQLILQNVQKFRKEHWSKVVDAFVTLFETTTAYQLFLSQGVAPPITPTEEIDVIGLKINGLAHPAANEETDRTQRERLSDSVSPTNGENDTTHGGQVQVSASKKKEFNQIIVKCVLQLLMIDTVSELFLNDEVYTNIPSQELLVLMRVLKKSFTFARKFNNDKDLRVRLWKQGFMKQLPNLLKQESGAASTYIHILLRMYHDTTPDRVANKQHIEEALVPLCVDIIKGYTVLDEETQQRNISAWRPVVIEVVEGYLAFSQADFAKHAEAFYPLGVDLLSRDQGQEIRLVVQSLFRRIGTVWIKGKGRDA
ncbi:uncharacterized protein V1510DRAFT_409312 [Dipodascopsis tothii]|uniref:uncharacterized protein n=1 Tax=Dipodascopsis tothii TaxID=44089 RepID=UPI0034CF6E52